jgi:hypothetical protein
MKDLVHDALAEARDLVGEVVAEGRQDNALTDDQVLAQYETMRGDPWQVIRFTEEKTGLRGREAVREAARYEQEMERLRAGGTG